VRSEGTNVWRASCRLGSSVIELEVVFAMSHLLLRYGRGQHHDILH